MQDKDMSPLRYYTLMQSQKLADKFNNENLIVDFAMRYGSPSIKSKIEHLKEKGCENLIILPYIPNMHHLQQQLFATRYSDPLMKLKETKPSSSSAL